MNNAVLLHELFLLLLSSVSSLKFLFLFVFLEDGRRGDGLHWPVSFSICHHRLVAQVREPATFRPK